MLTGTSPTTTTPAKTASTEVPKTEASTTSSSTNTFIEIAGETKREGVVPATTIPPTSSTTTSSSSSSSSSTTPYPDPRFSTTATSFTSSSSSSTSDYPTSSATTVSTTAPVPLSADPLKAALQAHYRTKDHLPGLLTDHKQPIADINLSIIEYQAHTRRSPERKEEKDEKGEGKDEAKKVKAGDEALVHYETLHNVSHPIPVADIFAKAPNAEGKLEAKPAKRLLILGPAGVGKTTMSQYLAYQWATGQLWAGQFDYVFWIPLRHLAQASASEAKTTLSLADVIQRECLAEASMLAAADIERVLKEKAGRTLLLLDGYDEVAHLLENPRDPLVRLLTGALGFEYIILTSRPHQLHHLDLSRFDRRLENTGFTDANIESYVTRYFATLTPPQPEQAKTLLDFLKANPSIWGTAHIPINLALLCDIWQNQMSIALAREGREIKEDKAEIKAVSAEAPILHSELSITGLYQAMTIFLLKRYLEKKGVKTRNQGSVWLQKQCALELEFLGLLAFKGLQTHQITLSKSLQHQALDEIQAKLPTSSTSPFDAILDSGFLRVSGDGRQEEIDKPHYFIHLTFQEYLAAHYLVRCLNQDPKTAEHRQAIRFLQTEKYTARYQIVLGFIAGLLTAEAPSGEASPAFLLFWNTLLSEPWDITGIGHIRLMIRCLEEANCDRRIPHRDTLLEQARDWLLSRDSTADSIASASSLVAPTLRSALKVLRHSRIASTLLARREFSIIEELGPAVATPEVTRALIARLHDTDSSVRHSAARVLGQLGTAAATPEVIQALIALLRDIEDSGVRESAAFALGQLGMAAVTPEVIQALIALLRDTDFGARHSAARALGQLGTAVGPEDIRVLIDMLNDIDSQVRCSAVFALVQLGTAAATPEVIRALIALLRDTNSDVRGAVAIALGQLGITAAMPEVIQALITLLRDTEFWVRSSAARALGQLGTAARPEDIRVLIDMLNDIDSQVRRSAANALGQLGTTARPEDIRVLIDMLNDIDFQVRRSAANALGQLGIVATTPEVIQALITLLHDKGEPWVRRSAANALGQLGKATATPEALSTLITLLRDTNSDIRKEAAGALGQFGTAAATPEVIQALIALLRDKDSGVRSSAAQTLGQFGTAEATPVVIRALIDMLNDINSEVRSSAADVLSQLETAAAKPEVIRALIALLRDTDSGARSSAARALGKLGTAAAKPETFSALITLLRDTDFGARYSATNALGQLGTAAATPEVIRALIDMLCDMEERVRDAAAYALGKLSTATIIMEIWIKTQDVAGSEPMAAYLLQQAIPMTLTPTALHIHEGRSSTAIPLPTDKGPLLVESLINAFAKQARELHLPG